MRLVLVVIVTLLISTPVYSAAIYVPDNYPTIQDAITASVSGDTIIVRPGTYRENIDFLGKAIVVKSEHGMMVTTLDGRQVRRVVTFANGEGSGSVLEGFTVTNGSHSKGGGIGCVASAPTIRNNMIIGNEAQLGGGISCENFSAPNINKNTIMNNTTERDGGGIFCDQTSSPTIEGNSISYNLTDGVFGNGGGIYIDGNSSGTIIKNNTITRNATGYGYGGGICCVGNSSGTIIENNIITGNTAGESGGGISIADSGSTIRNNTIVGNIASQGEGGGIYCEINCSPIVTNTIIWDNTGSTEIGGAGTPSVTYCCVEGGYSGTGNHPNNPQFVTGPFGDYYLSHVVAGQQTDSPCIDGGDPNSQFIVGTTRTDEVQDAVIVDMGYHYFIIPPPSFSFACEPEILLSGQYALFEATNGKPSTHTFPVYSVSGPGTKTVPPLNVTFDLANPALMAPYKPSDSQGRAMWVVIVPPGIAGMNIWFQAAQYGQVSNVIATYVQ